MRVLCLKDAAFGEASAEVVLGVDGMQDMTLARVLAAAKALVPQEEFLGGQFALKYVDVEGDEVTIASDGDVREAVEYMEDEGLERLVVWVKPTAMAALQQHLHGLIQGAVAFAKGLEDEEKPQAPSVTSVMRKLKEGVKVWEVEDELDGLKTALLTVLGNQTLVKVLEELATGEEFGAFIHAVVTAIADGGSVEAVMTEHLDVALRLLSVVVTKCPDLKSVMVRLVVTCGVQVDAYNTSLAVDDPMPPLIDISSIDTMTDSDEEEAAEIDSKPPVIYDDHEEAVEKNELEMKPPAPVEKEQVDPYADLVHDCYQCDGCDQIPIRGIRYRSTKVDSFDLCKTCYGAKRYEESHGPFEAITEFKPVHFNAICDGCNANPITGVRYKSIKVTNFDLCEACEASGRWSSHEPFLKIKKPEDCPWNIATHFDPPQVHPFVTCDGCGMSPLVGLRFKSSAVQNFDLCEVCKRSEQWDSTHGPFTLIEKPRDLRQEMDMCRHARRWIEHRMGREGRCRHHRGRFHGPRGCRPDEDVKPCAEQVRPPPPCAVRIPRSEPTLSAKYVRDVTIPDGEKVAPDSVIVKAWRIQNDGPAEWPLGCVLKMQTGRVGISPFEVQGDMPDVPVPTLVPGAEYTVEVRVRTPSDPGRYKAYWRMCDPSGKTFGHRLWIDVDVSEATTAVVLPSVEATLMTEQAFDVQSNATTEVSESTVATASAPDAEEDVYAEMLTMLSSMGFEDVEMNRQALAACEGNVNDAVNMLLA